MSKVSESAIGGYFELELPRHSKVRYPDAYQYQSARAAFLDLLRQMPNVKRLWMPKLICEAMLAPIREAGKKIQFYSLTPQLEVCREVVLSDDDLLLYVNYFGVCTMQTEALLLRFDPSRVLIDCAQAFYTPPFDCLATLYSPRKFFGLPDAGLLVTRLAMVEPKIRDSGSASRMLHLIKRLSGETEEGYSDYKQAEESLNDLIPRRISRISERLLSSVDHEYARIVRNHNFDYLHCALGQRNELKLPAKIDGPLCYPFMPQKPIPKELFFQNRIFIATYWPEVLQRIKRNDFEFSFVNRCLPIPCDQRYSDDHLDRILELIDKKGDL